VIKLLIFSLSVPLALAGNQRLVYKLFYRIQASSLWWLRLTSVLAVLGIQSALLIRCLRPLKPLLSDNYKAREQTEQLRSTALAALLLSKGVSRVRYGVPFR